MAFDLSRRDEGHPYSVKDCDSWPCDGSDGGKCAIADICVEPYQDVNGQMVNQPVCNMYRCRERCEPSMRLPEGVTDIPYDEWKPRK